ncbi:ATP binding microtubule motor family protein [Zea mays]|uniref:ATP binding microtubule motor family protein n=1 Tax=Zea mays TaxID=4577 RepID=A0A1D6QVC1_MAIZE|nr:ATP binding microtubule motor family protein [Zea mays]
MFVTEFFADKYRRRDPLASSSLLFLCVLVLATVTPGSSSPRLPLRILLAEPCCQRRRLILDYFIYSADNCELRRHSCHTAPQLSCMSSFLVPSDTSTWLGSSM